MGGDKNDKNEKEAFHGEGFFDWQFSSEHQRTRWHENRYDEDKYWGGFARGSFDPDTYELPDWAIGPFVKYEGNPVMGPTPGGWDCGHFGGAAHNGSILHRNGKFYYIYRGEFPLPPELRGHPDIDYCCDVGIATSLDGINWEKDHAHSPALRPGGNEKYSFEDVNVVSHNGRYYMYLNRWDWAQFGNPKISGIYIATSDDLLHWEHVGLAYPEATRIHRNGTVVQNPQNEAVKINGKFVMYINDGLMGYSDDLIHWESVEIKNEWPGGECAVAICDHRPNHPDDIILFTGGHHTGHFYAKGEVLFSKRDVTKPLEWLPRPILWAEPKYPYEDGYSTDGKTPISHWRDTVFFTGITLHEGKWRVYYGGSEYYTCLATADYKW